MLKHQDIVSFFCRHIIAVCVTYQVKGEPEPCFFAAPATVICFGKVHHLLTAGHVVNKLERLFANKSVVVTECLLADSFSNNIVNNIPIPFDFENAKKGYIDKEGLDFGLVALENYYVRLLKVNKIVALYRKNWIYTDDQTFDFYAVLGLPEEFSSFDPRSTDPIAKITPTILFVDELTELPKEVKKTKYARFAGYIRIMDGISDLKGMSGGPILGFQVGPPMRYWVVAIQSSWIKKRRIIFGCRISLIGNLVETLLETNDLTEKY